MLSVNTGESTAADRAKLYVDGDRITSFSTQTTSGSVNTQFNYSSATFRIGSTTSGSYDFDGYLGRQQQVKFLNDLILDLGLSTGSDIDRDKLEIKLDWGTKYNPTESEIKSRVSQLQKEIKRLVRLIEK